MVSYGTSFSGTSVTITGAGTPAVLTADASGNVLASVGLTATGNINAHDIAAAGTLIGSGGNGLKLNSGTVPLTPTGAVTLFDDAAGAFSLDPSGNIRSLGKFSAPATADQTTVGTGQTSSTYLTQAVEANATYLVECLAYWTVANAATVTTSWATTATGATMIWNDTTSGGDVVTTLAGVAPLWATGTKMVMLKGVLVTAGVAGALTFTLASSVAASATLKIGSYLLLDRIK